MTKNRAKPVIVLVEDHPDIVSMYSVVFEALLDATVFVGNDYTKGLSLIHEKEPDLVLLDLIIPIHLGDSFEPTSRHGFDLLEELRKDEEFKELPVMVLTNLESMKDRAHAEKLGAKEYIIKSQMLPNQIAKRVKEFLKEHR